MKKMTLNQHFSELRRRILWTAAVFVVALIGGWFVAPWAQRFFTVPLINVWPDAAVLYSGLTDGLMIQLSLAVTFAVLVTLPVALWHIWAYVSPGLRLSERNFIWPAMVLSPILFVAGAAFAFYVLFPFVFGFFVQINTSAPVPAVMLPSARDYLSLVLGMMRVFGVAFQLPLVMVLMNRIGLLSRAYAVRMRRYAIVLIMIAAAMLTPPDIVSQLLLALPMWLLFEAGVFFMRRDD